MAQNPSPQTHAKAAAANALMAALEAWASSLGDAGITKTDGARYYPTRSIPPMRRAHDQGRLFEYLTEWLPTYRGLGHGSQAAADRMAELVSKGLPCWEEIVADPNAPWAAQINPADRAILQKVMADVHARAARLSRAHAAAQALIAKKKAARR
jgi:hypothetical protein